MTEDNMKNTGTYLFMDSVNPGTIKPIIEWIINENLSPTTKKDKLTLIISSPGGEVASCMALIDIIKASEIPVHTIGLGQISSCGLMIFIAGAKGHRVLTPNTMILSHQFSWGSSGKEHELIGAMKKFQLSSVSILDHYLKCTGLQKEIIQEKLLCETDIWLDAKEALQLGLCDEIKEIY